MCIVNFTTSINVNLTVKKLFVECFIIFTKHKIKMSESGQMEQNLKQDEEKNKQPQFNLEGFRFFGAVTCAGFVVGLTLGVGAGFGFWLGMMPSYMFSK